MILPLKKQVTSLELSKKLKELGVKQDSLWYWTNLRFKGERWKLFAGTMCGRDNISAFTVAELGEVLPHSIRKKESTYLGNYYYLKCTQDKYKDVIRYIVYYLVPSSVGSGGILGDFMVKEPNEANARAKMLIWLIENGKVKA